MLSAVTSDLEITIVIAVVWILGMDTLVIYDSVISEDDASFEFYRL